MSNSASVKGGGDLVFDDLDLGAVAGDGAVGGLDLADAADIDADGGEELEGAAAGGGFRVAEHDADFLADLVGEDADGAGLGDEGGEFAHGGAHQAGLGTDGGIADLAVEFLLGDQGGDGVEHDDVDGVGADERLADLQGFLAGGGLGDEQVVEVDAEFAGVLGVERVLDVDEGGEAAAFLGLGDDGEGEGGFAGGFRAEDFDDAAAGEAADAEGAVDEQVAGGDDIDIDALVVAEAHDGGFAEFLLDVGDGEVEVAFAGFLEFFGGGFFGGCFGGHVCVGLCRRTYDCGSEAARKKKDVRSNKKCLSNQSWMRETFMRSAVTTPETAHNPPRGWRIEDVSVFPPMPHLIQRVGHAQGDGFRAVGSTAGRAGEQFLVRWAA